MHWNTMPNQIRYIEETEEAEDYIRSKILDKMEGKLTAEMSETRRN